MSRSRCDHSRRIAHPAVMTTMPTPMLNVRNISSRSTPPARSSCWKRLGIVQLVVSTTASASDGSARFRFPGNPAARDVRHARGPSTARVAAPRDRSGAPPAARRLPSGRHQETDPGHVNFMRSLNDAAREREAVGVQPAARQTRRARRPSRTRCEPENRVLVHVPDDEAREIVVGRRVDPRHLGRLAAEQRAAVLATSRRDAGDHAFDVRRLERAERDVVQEEQRQRALNEDVVDAVVDEIMADGVVPAALRSRPSASSRRRRRSRRAPASARRSGTRNIPPNPPNSPRAPAVSVDNDVRLDPPL